MSLKILVVDDSASFRQMLKEYFQSQRLNCLCFEAPTAEAGIGLALQEKPHLVIMDVWLPRMNGIHAAERIKNVGLDCDIIIVTMFEAKEFRQTLGSYPAVAYIEKHNVYDQLMPTIKRCCEDKGIALKELV